MPLVVNLLAPIQQALRKCPRQTIAQAYVRAARELCGRSRWYRVPITAPIVQGEAQYSLGSDPHLEVIDVPIASITLPQLIQPLVPAPATNFNPNAPQNPPLNFAYVPENQIMFWPTPDADYTVTLTLALQPTDTATELPFEMLRKWQRAFEWGAFAYLYDLPGEPWFSHEMADINRRKFEVKINDAQADVERGYTYGSRRAIAQRFVVQA